MSYSSAVASCTYTAIKLPTVIRGATELLEATAEIRHQLQRPRHNLKAATCQISLAKMNETGTLTAWIADARRVNESRPCQMVRLTEKNFNASGISPREQCRRSLGEPKVL